MGEIFDEYIDQFTLGAGAYGVALNFRRSNPKPVAPGSTPVTDDIGTIRMSLEHFKVMTYIMKRQIDDIEEGLGIKISIPHQLLNGLKIAPEDWQKFWHRTE